MTGATRNAALDSVIMPRTRDLGDGFEVRRALPSAQRRMVGPFVFFDQMGPVMLPAGRGLDVRPHPHIGLATVTYLFDGEILHRDSLGNAQSIRPGAVNWMTAGRGIVHSERTPPELRAGESSLFGIQTWVALPKGREEMEPGFAHHGADALPVIADEGKRLRLIAGSLYGERAPVEVFSEMFYADAMLSGTARLDFPAEDEERAAWVAEGRIEVAGDVFNAGQMLVFRLGEAVAIKALDPARLILFGGKAMDGPRHVWWNFVSSSTERIEQAKADWKAGRFGKVPGDEAEFIPLPEESPRPVAPSAPAVRRRQMTDEQRRAVPSREIWPELPFEAWQDTYDTLQLWTQIVGKVRLAKAPMMNHWWQVPLYVTSRGLTTSPIPHDSGQCFQIDFDFIDHRLLIEVSDGRTESLPLAPRSVADFYREVMDRLKALGLEVRIWTMPVEIPDPIPFQHDREHAAYDVRCAHQFWRALVQVDRVLKQFRSGFLGKASPVHFFWGSFDMAATRFSGRLAPPHPSAPNLADRVTREAYSHEVSSCGFWPGKGLGQAAFYSYAYPEPAGYADALVLPDGASYSQELHEFILPYDVARRSAAPDQTVLQFLESTYAAAADLGHWNRAAMERQSPR